MTRTGSDGRCTGRSATSARPESRVLADLPPGAVARIVAVVAPAPALAGRLADLGFTAGTVVQVVRRAPLGDPVIYRLKDYEVGLRRALAACVRVTEEHR